MAAQAMAVQARRKGLAPTVITLTDGRANMALDGTANRTQAATDAQTIARALRAARVDSIVIDTGKRAEPSLSKIADILGGTYIALPRADARSVAGVVASTLDI